VSVTNSSCGGQRWWSFTDVELRLFKEFS
jgi:hypothetical protein